jgi:hypothetical protein
MASTRAILPSHNTATASAEKTMGRASTGHPLRTTTADPATYTAMRIATRITHRVRSYTSVRKK